MSDLSFGLYSEEELAAFHEPPPATPAPDLPACKERILRELTTRILTKKDAKETVERIVSTSFYRYHKDRDVLANWADEMNRLIQATRIPDLPTQPTA